jgi:hypothetical protein
LDLRHSWHLDTSPHMLADIGGAEAVAEYEES